MGVVSRVRLGEAYEEEFLVFIGGKVFTLGLGRLRSNCGFFSHAAGFSFEV